MHACNQSILTECLFGASHGVRVQWNTHKEDTSHFWPHRAWGLTPFQKLLAQKERVTDRR